MALCKLTSPHSREPVWVNPSRVRYIEQQTEVTAICFGDSHIILVAEKAPDVAKALDDAERT